MNNSPSPPILEFLRRQVRAAAAEFDMAVMFYEVWRTAMDDGDLHARLGVSYTTNAFRIVVTALRRELLLALTRIWDKRRNTLRMDQIVQEISKPQVIALLAQERGSKIAGRIIRQNGCGTRAGADMIIASVQKSLGETAAKALAIADRYAPSRKDFAILEKLRTLRHERLAHYAIEAAAAPAKEATDQEIEDFYRDNSELVRLLLSLVTAIAYDPQEGAEVQRTYAKLFWASVRGERTKGHPNYRSPE